MHEAEWQTRKQRIDTRLRGLNPPWEIIPYHAGLDLARLTRHAVTEFPTANGPADYALFVHGRFLGVLEAKKLAVNPQNVLEQAKRYARGAFHGPGDWRGYRVPFLYACNGPMIWFLDVRAEKPVSRQLSAFHTAPALEALFAFDLKPAHNWLLDTPPDILPLLRDYQRQCLLATEAAILAGRRELLVAMATGTGKTLLTVAQIYRLLESRLARRILFLVDRKALAAQAVREFHAFSTPQNRKFTQEYEVYSQRFQREDFGPDTPFDPQVLPKAYLTHPRPSQTFVYVSTIQRMARNLFGAEDWSAMDVDVKAAAFEGLLEKAASEGKKGVGGIFTPRVLQRSIVRVMKPDPRGKPAWKTCDPACGTDGFEVCAYEWLVAEAKGVFDRADARRIKTQTYYGQDILPRARRLALMNLFLHGVEAHIHLGDSIYEPDRGERYDVVLTNPPFGTKGANQAPEREDFTIATSSKQLNFVQHVLTLLKPGGRAAMVLPDNCLFEDKAGEVFEILMQDCALHTVLRLPRGTFTPYSQGVKANVIFFQKGRPTEEVWIFDARSNVPGITKKDRPLTPQHFAEFEAAYGKDPNGLSKRKDTGETGRFRRFRLGEIKERGYKLDITWLKDESLEDSDELPEPQDLAAEAITEFEAIVDDLRDIIELLEKEEGVEK